MRPSLLAAVLILAVAAGAFGKEKASTKDTRTQGEVRQVLEKYLDARFRGADWKEVAPLVLWSQEDEPACTTVVRSYDADGNNVRLKDKDTALASVSFYQLGTYCPAEHKFTSVPHVDRAVFQLRRKSIVWLVEKSGRPGGQVAWQVIRERLKKQLADPALSVADTARVASSLSLLEKTANAIGKRSD